MRGLLLLAVQAMVDWSPTYGILDKVFDSLNYGAVQSEAQEQLIVATRKQDKKLPVVRSA